MEGFLSLLVPLLILALVIGFFLFITRHSTDVRLEGDLLILRYPFRKETIDLQQELKSWNLQEANYLRMGKIYAVNLELRDGKWKKVNSRFNAETFASILSHLNQSHADKQKQ